MKIRFKDLTLSLLTVNGASDGLGGSEDLLTDTGEVLRHGAGTHHAGSTDNIVQSDVTGVLDVLDLLPVTGRLFEGLDDEGGGRGNNGDLKRSDLIKPGYV